MSLALAVSLVRLLSANGPQEPDLSRHWATDQITLEVQTGHGAPEGLLEAAERAAAAWNQTGAGPLIQVVESEAQEQEHELLEVDQHCRVGVLRGSWPYPSQAGAATVAWTSVSTQQIFEADVALNPGFDFGDAAEGAFDLQSALTHELGHVLGLPELVDQPEATMYPTIPPGETKKRDLAEVDVDTLIEAYQQVELAPPPVAVAPVEAPPPLDEEREPVGGCAQGQAAPTATLGLLLLALPLARRRRRALEPRAARG